MKPYPLQDRGVAPERRRSGQARKILCAAGSRLLESVNGLGRRFFDDGRKCVSLDRENLLSKCRRVTGLDDFGGDDFLEPLEVLLRSFEEDANLNLIGRVTVRHEMMRLLCNRLCLQRDRRLFPAIGEEEIRHPVFITGLPRSGSTFLHALLAQDPCCRSPLVCEVMHPSPPPDCATFRTDPRIALAAKELSWIDVLMPGFERCHCIGATLPQECIAMTDHSFLSYLFESMYFVTSYRKWHDLQDKLPAYQYHRLFLQQLQWRSPGSHWVLKAPSHLMALESLFQVYPDARVVMTHRDPLKVLPSCASFAHLLRAPFTGRIDLVELGGEVSRRWAESALSATRFRAEAKGGGERFHDVNYPDLLRDPMVVVRGIYRFLDKELTAEAEEAMRLFIVQQPKDKHGAHLYSLEQFGLDAEAETEKFRQYSNYFGVAPER